MEANTEHQLTMNLHFNPGQENETWGYTLYLNQGNPTLYAQDWAVHTGRVGVINNHGAPIDVSLYNCTFIQGPYPTAWGMKLFECRGNIVECDFIGLGDRGSAEGDEPADGHPAYFSPTGDILFEDCRFMNNGGNLQLVNRDYGFPLPSTGEPVMDANPTEATSFTVSDCVFHNNAWNHVGNGGGGAAQIAAYNATHHGTSIHIDRTVFSNTRPYPGKEAAKQGPSPRAAIVVWHECWQGKPDPDGGKVGNLEPDATKFFEELTINECHFRTTQADRALIQVSGTKKVQILNSRFDFIGGHFSDTDQWKPIIQIDKDETDPVRATYIHIDPVFGAAGSFIEHTLPDGVVLQIPLQDGYHYEA